MRGVLFFLILQLAAVAVAPWIAAVLPTRDRGYGLARVLGWLGLGLACWLLTLAGLPTTGWLGWAVLLLALAPLARPDVRRRWARIPLREIVAVEGLFFGVTALFLFFRSCRPEIYWGEKPMDFTFLNFFIRLEHLPPEDPWAAGSRMRYYYLGYYLLGLLHKMTGLRASVGYNLSLGMLAGLFASAGYSALRPLMRRRLHAALGAVALLLFGDFESFRLAMFQTQRHGFDLFWDSSRIMKAAIANEYPLWSFLFGDLHAHLISLPFSLSALALGIACFARTPAKARLEPLAHAALYGVVWGSLIAINTWDFLSLGIVTVALLLFDENRARRGMVMALYAGLTALPFLPTIANGGAQGIRLERHAFFTVGELLRYCGQFLLPAAAIAAWCLRDRLARRRRALLAAGTLVLGIAAVSLLCRMNGMVALPWAVTALSSAVAAIGMATAAGRGASRRARAIGFLLLATGLLIWLGEYFFVRERLNSLFKLSIPIWLLSGLALGGLVPYTAWRGRRWRSPAFLRWPTVAALGAGAIGGLVNVVIMTEFQRIEGPRGTLDGLAYLERSQPEERALVDFLQNEIRGVPRIAEAWGRPYGPFTRIAMRTGLPTWVGWEHHVKQRGLAADLAVLREQQLATLYEGTDADAAWRFLREHAIELVVVGSLERATYGSRGLEKFRDPRRFRELARFGDQAVYRVLSDDAYSTATKRSPSMPN